MVLAAARVTARKAVKGISRGGHNGPGQSATHRLHSGAPVRHASTTAYSAHGLGPCPSKPPRSPPHRLFTQSRNLWTRIFNQLTAPGLRVPTYLHNTSVGASRSLHSGFVPNIKSGLSFHARTALSSSPRHKVYLPRPPSAGVQVATNVGLGTARNFSTARPIFQNLIENTPVVARAFYEADLDLRKPCLRRPSARRVKTSSHKKAKELLKPRDAPLRVPSQQEDPSDEVEHYFDTIVPPVATYLFVPIAPTPSSRVPLPAEPILPNDAPGLLPPLSLFGPYHHMHENHTARVFSLFQRLDQGLVWSRGATYSAYGHGGVCTVLKVEFAGWTESEVRAVIGEAGTGWCWMEEYRFNGTDDMSEFSSSIDPVEAAAVKNSDHAEVSSSFVMPTLDLSSSMFDSSLPSSPSMESISLPSSRFSSRPMSPFSDVSSEYDDPWRNDEMDGHGSEPHSTRSNTGSERSWQRMGAVEFSSQHLNQWD